ncbi:AI-2E family transporter [Hyphomicrobium sulfonivorans]|uniref:AI-2E family transporter n=1 Tax=Hyphomicrobium sulfonivorans TaxID=121290 RepID=UPI00156E3BD6|nr:AI-2E family transporter [Hyphomicrobium sulfonivorans]MBI1648910.1 AI-2E family transporter [Hyphomicrobium sulfonivorans]NSL70554.1 AI-2E family transporter [Hyphomicrobium sulfonivorans]
MRVERQVLFWLAAAIVLILLIALLRGVILPFVAGIVIAYFLNPLADRLTQWGLPRGIAATLIVAAFACVLVAAIIFLVPLLVSQAQQFAAALPDEIRRLRALIETWAREQLGSSYPEFEAGMDRSAQALTENMSSFAGYIASSLWSQGRALFDFLSLLLVTPLVVFYVLIDWHPMLAKLDSWLPRAHASTIRKLASEVNGAVSAFIRGQGTVCLVLAVYYAVALAGMGLRYGLLVGLVTGLMSFVPFVGWALGLITATTIAFVQFWPETVPILTVVAIFGFAQVLDAGFLGPKIVGSKIGLHPVWLIFSLFVFSYLFGFVGVLVAVPIAAATGVLVRFALQLYLASPVYSGVDSPAPLAGSGAIPASAQQASVSKTVSP